MITLYGAHPNGPITRSCYRWELPREDGLEGHIAVSRAAEISDEDRLLRYAEFNIDIANEESTLKFGLNRETAVQLMWMLNYALQHTGDEDADEES